jgi:hypothetical protein
MYQYACVVGCVFLIREFLVVEFVLWETLL